MKRNRLIAGSIALKYWYPDFKRTPKDTDYICKDKNPFTNMVEYHWVDSFQYIIDNNKDPIFVDPDFLYTIKVSHAAWDVKWDKTMSDIMFLKNKGCKLDYNLYRMLVKEWQKIHGLKSIRVKGTPDEFFTSKITRAVNHDQLHQMFKFGNVPMHEHIRLNPKDVACSVFLWDQLNEKEKLNCVLEEAYVFAIERYYTIPPKIAFIKALKTLITQSTKGWFNLFIIEHFSDLVYHDYTHFLTQWEKYKGEIYGQEVNA